MDSLYAKYLKDRHGTESFFEKDGFVTYRIVDLECFLVDMCISAESRGRGRGRDMVDRLELIAREAGCKCITANIHLNLNGADKTLRASLAVGFRVIKAQNDILMIAKDITGE